MRRPPSDHHTGERRREERVRSKREDRRGEKGQKAERSRGGGREVSTV
jgi:hypothetical protein